MMNQNYMIYSVRAAAILTGTYVAGTIIEGTHLENQLIINVTFVKGSLTSAQIKVEFSNDSSNYYQETVQNISGGTSTDSLLVHSIDTTGGYRIAVPIKDRFIKISAIGTGTATNSSMTIDAVVGIA